MCTSLVFCAHWDLFNKIIIIIIIRSSGGVHGGGPLVWGLPVGRGKGVLKGGELGGEKIFNNSIVQAVVVVVVVVVVV